MSYERGASVVVKNGSFIFTDATLEETFAEISNEYSVEIEYLSGSERRYTGRFRRSQSADQVLRIVCRSMKLKIEKVADKKYIVSN
ncbi:MAG: DUF4974 domain-containing protein [Rikenellaceae bacterium]